MTNPFLDYDVTLLLARYGEKSVLSALSKALDLSEAELQAKLSQVKQLQPKKTGARPRVDPSVGVERLFTEHPQKAQYLRTLFSRYQRRSFLPELKDVQRFFDGKSIERKRFKSRAEASQQVFKLLATHSEQELAALCQEPEQSEYSSLGLISDEIMRRGK